MYTDLTRLFSHLSSLSDMVVKMPLFHVNCWILSVCNTQEHASIQPRSRALFNSRAQSFRRSWVIAWQSNALQGYDNLYSANCTRHFESYTWITFLDPCRVLIGRGEELDFLDELPVCLKSAILESGHSKRVKNSTMGSAVVISKRKSQPSAVWITVCEFWKCSHAACRFCKDSLEGQCLAKCPRKHVV